MPGAYSHVFAFPFEILSEKSDASDLDIHQLRQRLLESVYQMSQEDLEACLQRYHSMENEDGDMAVPTVDQEQLNHDFPAYAWYKDIDKGDTTASLLEWQLKKERELKEKAPEVVRA